MAIEDLGEARLRQPDSAELLRVVRLQAEFSAVRFELRRSWLALGVYAEGGQL